MHSDSPKELLPPSSAIPVETHIQADSSIITQVNAVIIISDPSAYPSLPPQYSCVLLDPKQIILNPAFKSCSLPLIQLAPVPKIRSPPKRQVQVESQDRVIRSYSDSVQMTTVIPGVNKPDFVIRIRRIPVKDSDIVRSERRKMIYLNSQGVEQQMSSINRITSKSEEDDSNAKSEGSFHSQMPVCMRRETPRRIFKIPRIPRNDNRCQLVSMKEKFS